MDSFEGLGLGPELVEALASEGVEEPTPFQTAAIPVIRRGNNLLGWAGPGAGTLVAYGAALLDRLETGAGAPRALVLIPAAAAAEHLAESLADLASATGHTVASAGSPWALPERADVLFGTPAKLLAWAREGRLAVHGVEALVIEQATVIQRTGGLTEIEALLEFLPRDCQRVLLALPVTAEIEDFVARHLRRAVQIPPRAASGQTEGSPRRGDVRYRIVEEPRAAGALQLVSELLEDTSHACLFFATEESAADVGDYLTLHGYRAGRPGDPDAAVWLAVGEFKTGFAPNGSDVVAVSYDPPAGPDALDRRHGRGMGGAVIVLSRELPHLKDVARRTGYRVVPFPPPVSRSGRTDLDALLARLDTVAGEVDLAPYLIALEPLLQRRGAAETAAAAVALLRERAPAATPAGATRDSQAAPATRPSRAPAMAPASPAIVRLYLSLGERDNVAPGDIVGAITGEAGVDGSQIGRIEIRDTFSIVEVQEPIASRVIRALNGITVRGRSVRADYDRGARGPAQRRGKAQGREKSRSESRGKSGGGRPPDSSGSTAHGGGRGSRERKRPSDSET